MPLTSYPRVVLAGLSGDSGKTLASLGLILAARRADVVVRAFKKGPDYIDPGWLAWASACPARNLDTYLMDFEGAASSFTRHATPAGLNIIEGNRGLFDGVDPQGTHSTAELAKTLQAPVVLVVDASKATRTLAASVLGCQKLDPDLQLAGVILNRVGSRRHAQVIREAIEAACGVPVLGAIPRIAGETPLPSRHLGLVTAEEYSSTPELRSRILDLAGDHLDLHTLLAIASIAPPLPTPAPVASTRPQPLTIGFIKDSAFMFYYPENLEALEAAGARLVPISALTAHDLPGDLDALYIGGGFPENHAPSLAANRPFLAALKQRAAEGLPVYAECGGLMLLCRSIRTHGASHRMSGVLPLDAEVCDIPQGHGYARLMVDRENPFYPVGAEIKGHEFHYSKVVFDADPPPSAAAVQRGTGCFNSRDGIVTPNVWASYTHVHALGTPLWADGLIAAARRYACARPALIPTGGPS